MSIAKKIAKVKIHPDTRRLNWLETHGAGLNNAETGGHVWLNDPQYALCHFNATTYRGAIDEAIGLVEIRRRQPRKSK